MPLRRGFSAARLADAAEVSVKKARESLEGEFGELLAEPCALACRYFFALLSLHSLTSFMHYPRDR